MLILASPDAEDIRERIEQAMNLLRRLMRSADEPMFNLLLHFDGGRFVAILFPRRAHRPACYFATGNEHLAVSPAVLEMAGLLVTTEADHFHRIDAATAVSIYEQVGLEPSICEQLAAQLA
jgi:hypothetical protein